MKLLGEALPLLLAILWSGWLGWRVARPLLSSLSREEKIAWGVGIGFLLQIALFSVFLLLRFQPRPVWMLAAGAVIGLGTLLRKTAEPAAPAALPRGIRVLLAAAALAWVLFLLQAVVEPMWANDYLAIWGFKARTIALSSSVPPRLFHDPVTAWSHPEYPLLLPLLLSAFSALTGSWNDRALALLYPAFFAATLLALFGFFRRRGNALAGAIAAALASSFFFLYQAFEVGMAEVPLAFALVLVVLSASDLDDEIQAFATWRLGIAAFLCCGIKQEGTLFVVLLAASIAVRGLLRKKSKPALRPGVLLAAAELNWAILRLLRGPLSDRDYDLKFLSSGKLLLLLGRLKAAGSAVLASQGAAVAVPAAALALLLILTPRSRLDWVLPVLAVQILAYVWVCALSSFDPVWQAQFVSRVAGPLFPVLAAVLGERSSRIFREWPKAV